MGAFRHPISVASPAPTRHLLGFIARTQRRAGNKMLPTVDPRGPRHLRADSARSRALVPVSLLGCGDWTRRCALLFSPALVVGMLLIVVALWAANSKTQRPRQMVDARHSAASAPVAGPDDVRQVFRIAASKRFRATMFRKFSSQSMRIRESQRSSAQTAHVKYHSRRSTRSFGHLCPGDCPGRSLAWPRISSPACSPI